MITDLGITGTRDGMTKAQEKAFLSTVETLLKRYPMLNTFHHGCCIGVDTEAAQLLKDLYNFKVIDHPPINKSLIGEFKGDEIREDKSYFARNRDIVNESQIIIAITKEAKQPVPSKGGTWYTLNYAISSLITKQIYHILPDGNIVEYNV